MSASVMVGILQSIEAGVVAVWATMVQYSERSLRLAGASVRC